VLSFFLFYRRGNWGTGNALLHPVNKCQGQWLLPTPRPCL
jgi:hypothetical protein